MNASRENPRVDQDSHGHEVMEISARHLSPKLLILGAILGLFGVVFTVTNSLLVFYGETTNPLGKPFASGNGYWPLTVSEAVSKQDSASCAVFFAFCLLGGGAIFMSWYPFHLRNAYTGDKAVFGTCLRWTTIRQVFPPVGLILLSIVPMRAAPLAKFSQKVAQTLHGVGAGLAFGGYFICEVYALIKRKEIGMGSTERILRTITCAIFVICFAVFAVCYVIDKVNTRTKSICCLDTWEEASWTEKLNRGGEEMKAIHEQMYLWDTASDRVLILKFCGYFGECLAFTAVMVNMIVIWYFCEERLTDVTERPLAHMSLVDDESDGTDADQ